MPRCGGCKDHAYVDTGYLGGPVSQPGRGKLKVFVDPVEPVFIFVALLRLGAPSIKIKDFAKVDMGSLERMK